MGIAILVLAVSAVLAAWTLARSHGRPVIEPRVSRRSSLDHAERILAARYASGSITPQEYRRMLAILRT